MEHTSPLQISFHKLDNDLSLTDAPTGLCKFRARIRIFAGGNFTLVYDCSPDVISGVKCYLTKSLKITEEMYLLK